MISREIKTKSMYSYIVGKVTSLNNKSITVENNYIGYSIYVANTSDFEANRIAKIYIYKALYINNKNKIIEEIYGFKLYETKEMFMRLLNVSGVGYKTAIKICSNPIDVLKHLITQRDVAALEVLSGFTNKIARAVCDEIEGFNMSDGNDKNIPLYGDLVESLKSLGYSSKDIEKAVGNIDMKQNDLSNLISNAIKYIAVGKNGD